MKKRVEVEQAAFAFAKRRRDRRAVMMEIVPVATERALAEAIYSLVGRISGRETGSISTLEAVLPEAVAAEAVTSEAVPEVATLPEAMAGLYWILQEPSAWPDCNARQSSVGSFG